MEFTVSKYLSQLAEWVEFTQRTSFIEELSSDMVNDLMAHTHGLIKGHVSWGHSREIIQSIVPFSPVSN